jgi:hypothetical protein
MAFSVNGGAFSVLQPYSSSAGLTLPNVDGLYTITVEVFDMFGNSLFSTQTVRLDRAGPAISDTLTAPTNSGSYDVGTTLNIAYSATDIDNVKTITATFDGATISSGVAIMIDTLTAGVHTLVITATDGLGNKTSTTVTIQVHATANGLVNAVHDGASRGLISASEASVLVSQLQSMGNGNSAKTKLSQFINMVQSASGKSVASAEATLLVNWSQDLYARL